MSQEILEVIGSENKNDQKSLKELLLYYFEKKYQNKKEEFLDNIVNDLIDDNQSLLDKINEDKTLLEKAKNEYSQ